MKKLAYAAGAAAAGTAAVGKMTWDAYRYMMCRDTSEYMFNILDIADHSEDYNTARETMEEEMTHRRCIHLTTVSARGEQLAGYYFPSGDAPTGKIVFIVHGFRSNIYRTSGMYYELFASRGFDIFCCDNVAHGMSGGRYMGYDYFESEDCLHWIDCLRHCFGEDIQIIMLGQSLGGATVCKMSDRVPDNVKFIVDDCGFTSAVETLGKKAGPLFGLVNAITVHNAGYDLAQTNVRENVKKARVPMLFVHGRKDMVVPFSMSLELYDLCPTEKDRLYVDDAKHVECIYYAYDEYAKKIDEFIGKYIKG